MAPSVVPEGRSGFPRRLGRGAWWGLLGATAIVAAFAQFDQQSRSNTGLALLVPGPFQSQAASQLTMLLLDMGNGQAVSEAETLLRHNPVPAESLTLYGIAANANGKPDQAGRAVMLAAGRGWREPLAQATMFEAAMSARNYPAALDRLVALWRVGIRDQRIIDVFQRLAREEDGRKALVERLRTDKAWRDGFISWGRYNLGPREFSQILATGIAGGLSFECSELSDATSGLVRMGDLALVQQVWTSRCAANAKSLSSPEDFGFQPESARVSPANWSYPDKFGLTRSLAGSGGNTTMTANNSEPLQALVAERHAALSAGRYSLTVRAPHAGEGNPALARIEVACVRPGGQVSGAIQTSSSSDGSSSFFVPAADCAVQRYRVFLRRGSLSDFSLQLQPL
ncbi:MAG TPA: hypothetical protein VJQ77_01875 [Novosphingobium sp.]|nr:hypothetical protein [Novosphingobium sp.]